MTESSRRQFLFNAIASVGFVAIDSALMKALTKIGTEPAEPEIFWLLEQTDDANQNANLFFQAMFGMPNGVKVSMKQFGERFCETSQQNIASVVIEARTEVPNPENEQRLSELGFHPFQQFNFDHQLREQLKLVGIECS